MVHFLCVILSRDFSQSVSTYWLLLWFFFFFFFRPASLSSPLLMALIQQMFLHFSCPFLIFEHLLNNHDFPNFWAAPSKISFFTPNTLPNLSEISLDFFFFSAKFSCEIHVIKYSFFGCWLVSCILFYCSTYSN